MRTPGEDSWRYKAENDLLKMARRVIEEREFAFIARIRADLAEARRLAEVAGKVPKERLARLNKMSSLADQTERALKMFLKTSRLDVAGMFGVFKKTS